VTDDVNYGMTFGSPAIAGEVLSEDVRWHCTEHGVDGVGQDSLNAHGTDHIAAVTKWRTITGIRLESVSFVNEPLHPDWTVESVQRALPSSWSVTVPIVKIDAHRIAHAYALPCTLLGLAWHPGCQELPRRSRMRAAYHRRPR
jgi:hypothetical protein